MAPKRAKVQFLRHSSKGQWHSSKSAVAQRYAYLFMKLRKKRETSWGSKTLQSELSVTLVREEKQETQWSKISGQQGPVNNCQHIIPQPLPWLCGLGQHYAGAIATFKLATSNPCCKLCVKVIWWPCQWQHCHKISDHLLLLPAILLFCVIVLCISASVSTLSRIYHYNYAQ